MRFLLLVLALLQSQSNLFGASASRKGSYSFSLKAYQGSPLLIVFGGSKKDAAVRAQIESIRSSDSELRKAGVRTLYALKSENGRNGSLILREGDSADLRKTFGISDGDFKVVLVNKDGARIAESKTPLNGDGLNSWLTKKLKRK